SYATRPDINRQRNQARSPALPTPFRSSKLRAGGGLGRQIRAELRVDRFLSRANDVFQVMAVTFFACGTPAAKVHIALADLPKSSQHHPTAALGLPAPIDAGCAVAARLKRE